MKRYAKLKTLCEIFDLSEDWFKRRMATEAHPNNPFVEGIFFFVPPSESSTKKAVLWDVEVMEAYIRGEFTAPVSEPKNNKKIMTNLLKC